MTFLRKVRRLWRSSLPLRVLLTTLTLSLVVMVLAGVSLIQQATLSTVEAKKEASLHEAAGVYAFMQEQLRSPEARGVAIHETLNKLADLADSQAAQYKVVIQGPALNLVSSGITADSVPEQLKERVQAADGMFITPTLVQFSDPSVAQEPGWAVGTSLIGSAGERYPVYYIFPMETEVRTLRALQSAVALTGGVVVAALGVISYLVTKQVMAPVRKASSTALRLASGELAERMPVRGNDDIALLARSMNQMAAQLQRRIGELEALSTVQQRFVSDVSHELRTPMTTIKMAADVLYDYREDFPPVAERSAELLNSEVERFDGLLSELLEISRFDAGAAVLALEEVDVAVLVADEVALLQTTASSMDTQLELQVASGDVTAQLDPRRIRRIIRNLLTNAIEHAEARPINVTIAANDQAVAVSVRDHGVGFSADDARHVFDRFWRADPSRNRVIGGSGLGLSIAQEDARLHNGKLTAWGMPGQGAQFTLTLPKEEGAELGGLPLPLTPTDLSKDEKEGE